LTTLKDLTQDMPVTELTPEMLGGLEVTTVQAAVTKINMLVYGEPGVGKTVLAASAAAIPEMSPVLIIDIEGGTLSAAKMGFDCKTVRVKKWNDMQKVYDALYRGNHPYKTIVLDSLTEIQKFSMAEIMVKVVEEDGDRDPEVPSIREWGKNGEQTRRVVRGFRDLPMNSIFTCLSDADRDKSGNVTKTRPSLSGKLKAEVAGFVDIVAYMYKKTVGDNTQRLLMTSGTDKYVAKDRSDSLPAILQNPTMADIFAAVYTTNN
jgi:phage nucleotide-binding protein